MSHEHPLLTPTRIKNPRDLGALMRAFRKSQHLTLEKVSGLTHVSMRFLSELERGKETAELGKVLSTLNKLGLDVVIQPRSHRHGPSLIELRDDD